MSATKRRIIKIDRTRCMGTQACLFIAPNTFVLDDENIAFVVNPEGDSIEDVVRAAQSCPTEAIKLDFEGEEA